MRREYRLGKARLSVEFTGRCWVAKVSAPDYGLVCERGVHHQFPVDTTVEIDSHVVDNDSGLLDAYEWAIRGNTVAADRLLNMIVDEQVTSNYMDPCEVA